MKKEIKVIKYLNEYQQSLLKAGNERIWMAIDDNQDSLYESNCLKKTIEFSLKNLKNIQYITSYIKE